MRCPACKETLVVLEHQLVEVDHCIACGGIWLDKGELNLLAGAEQASAAARTQQGGASKRKCPECDRRMHTVSSSGDVTVPYEICTRCHGMWFDRGELHAILGGASSTLPTATEQWLRDVFGSDPQAANSPA